MTADTTIKPITGTVSKTSPTGTVEEDVINVGTVVLDNTPTAEVSYEMGYTMNLGNYQSARFHVGIKLPSSVDVESLDKSYDFVKDWVDTKLQAAIAEAKKDIG